LGIPNKKSNLTAAERQTRELHAVWELEGLRHCISCIETLIMLLCCGWIRSNCSSYFSSDFSGSSDCPDCSEIALVLVFTSLNNCMCEICLQFESKLNNLSVESLFASFHFPNICTIYRHVYRVRENAVPKLADVIFGHSQYSQWKFLINVRIWNRICNQ